MAVPMNIVYKLKWRRGDLGFWRSAKVIGHQYETGSNKLILYFPEGGLREIAHWNDCEMLLGSDWSKLTNDASGNVDIVKEMRADNAPPEPDTNIEETPEKKEEPTEKEEEIDDRTSS